MKYSKIITKKGMPLLDLTRVNVTPETLALGVTAINRDGELIVGVAEGVKSGITDVESLPVENIDPKKVYRILNTITEPMRLYMCNSPYGTGYYDDLMKVMLEQELGESVEIVLPVIEVTELPEIGEVPEYSDNPFGIKMIFYFLREENKLYMCQGAGQFSDAGSEENPFLGIVLSEAEATQTGFYLIEGSSYSVYHYWNYCDGQWIELIENIEVDELPTENIRRDVCYVKLVEGVKIYFIYKKNFWIGYSGDGGGGLVDFVSGASEEDFAIPDGVNLIAPYTFYNRKYKTIFIPFSVKAIKEKAFYGCDYLEQVFYGGSEEDWNKIVVAEGNDKISEAEKIYNYVKNTN